MTEDLLETPCILAAAKEKEVGVAGAKKKFRVSSLVYPAYFCIAGALVIELPQPWNGYAAGASVAGLYPLWMWALWNRDNAAKSEAEPEEPGSPT